MRYPLLPLYFLLAALFAFAVTPAWDADLWWHLASGRWIVTHLAIPASDPFGVFAATDIVRNDTVLQGQWLGQVLLYLFSLPAGIEGLIIVRALLLTACLALVWYRTPRRARPWALLLMIPAGMLSLGLTAERPQLFAYLMAGLCFVVLERCWRRRGFLPLMFVMTVLWANIHGSVLLWVVLTMLAGGFSLLRDVLRQRPLRRRTRRYLVLAALTLLAAMLTPNGWKTWWYVLDLQGSALQQATSEYISSLLLFRLGYWLPQLWVLLLSAAALVALWRLRPWRSQRAIWLGALLLLGLLSYRYLAFFLFIALPWVAAALPRRWLGSLSGTARVMRLALPALCAVAIIAGGLGGQALRVGIREDLFPVQAVDWAVQRGLQGRVFSTLRWGGYLLWQEDVPLRPWIDGRMLDKQRFPPYTHMLWATPEGVQQFTAEQFDYVLLPLRNRFGGEVYGLHDWLQQSGWRRLFTGGSGEVLWAPPLSDGTAHPR